MIFLQHLNQGIVVLFFLLSILFCQFLTKLQRSTHLSYFICSRSNIIFFLYLIRQVSLYFRKLPACIRTLYHVYVFIVISSNSRRIVSYFLEPALWCSERSNFILTRILEKRATVLVTNDVAWNLWLKLFCYSTWSRAKGKRSLFVLAALLVLIDRIGWLSSMKRWQDWCG